MIQYSIVYQLGNGRHITGKPSFNADWENDIEQKQAVPFGIDCGRLHFFSKLPMDVQTGTFYNIVKFNLSADWPFLDQIQFFLLTLIFTG